ncbi:Os11g0110033, partial [Oryza sativa Japonica Group]
VKNKPSMHGLTSALAGLLLIQELQHPSLSQDHHSSHHTLPPEVVSMLPLQLKVALQLGS